MSTQDKDTNSSGLPDGGSGRGGPTGTPSTDSFLAPPSSDQEQNAVVSGGGLVGDEDDDVPENDGEPSDAASS